MSLFNCIIEPTSLSCLSYSLLCLSYSLSFALNLSHLSPFSLILSDCRCPTFVFPLSSASAPSLSSALTLTRLPLIYVPPSLLIPLLSLIFSIIDPSLFLSLDCFSLKPIYKGSPSVKCSYCSSVAAPANKGSLCATCNLCTVKIKIFQFSNFFISYFSTLFGFNITLFSFFLILFY